MDQHKSEHVRQGKTRCEHPNHEQEQEQPETNMGNSGELNNKQPTATQRETRWKNKREQPETNMGNSGGRIANNHCNPMGNAEERQNEKEKKRK